LRNQQATGFGMEPVINRQPVKAQRMIGRIELLIEQRPSIGRAEQIAQGSDHTGVGDIQQSRVRQSG
jgi:hypothetical protein